MLRHALVVGSILSVAIQASGADQVFRGLDLNPTGIGALASFPQSDGARASYLAALGAPAQVQNFESVALGTPPAAWTFSGGLNASYQNNATAAHAIKQGVDPVTAYPADGSRFLYSETRPGSEFFTLTFGDEINSIGFYVSDASDWFNDSDPAGRIYIELLDANAGVLAKHDLFTEAPNAITNGSMLYFGVVADVPFKSARVAVPLRATGSNDSSDGVGFDQFTVAVPAPGSFGLLATAGLLAGRRRRA